MGGCLAAAWHYASLGFAEHPLRKHREWTGSVVPYNTLEARHSRSGSRIPGEVFDEEAPAFASAAAAKRRLFPGCGVSSPVDPTKTYGPLTLPPLNHKYVAVIPRFQYPTDKPVSLSDTCLASPCLQLTVCIYLPSVMSFAP